MLQNGCLPTGKVPPLSRMSSNINMASEIWTLMNPSGILRDVELNMKPKPKSHGSTLEGTRSDHLIYSAVNSTKLPLCCVILKRRTQKGEVRVFFKFQYF